MDPGIYPTTTHPEHFSQLKSSSVQNNGRYSCSYKQARSLSSPVTTLEVAAVESKWSEGKLVLLRTSALAHDEGPAEARCKS